MKMKFHLTQRKRNFHLQCKNKGDINKMSKSALRYFERTRFIFDTNFSGENDQKFHSKTRKGNIVLTEEQAQEMSAEGFNVKVTKPGQKLIAEGREDEFEPTYFVPIICNFESQYPPKVWLNRGEGMSAELLDAESVGILDKMWIESVDVCCSEYNGQNGKSLYVKSMDVTQHTSTDPIAARHSKRFDI